MGAEESAFKRNLCISESSYHVRYFSGGVIVVRALVVAKSVERREAWLANQFVILLNDELGASLSEHVDFKATSNSNVMEASSAIFIEVYNRGLEVGVVEVHAEEVSRFARLNEQEGMDSERLEAGGTVIENFSFILSPHLPRTFSQIESSSTLTESVNVLTR